MPVIPITSNIICPVLYLIADVDRIFPAIVLSTEIIPTTESIK
jgi:hypothetical protein